MPSTYLLPVKSAALVFPLLALLLYLPAAVITYRRHGIMSSWRTLSFYSFLFYALTAFCMTLVPLPGPSVDVCGAYPSMSEPQLTLGNTVADIRKEAGGATGFGALVLHNSAVRDALLNLLLLVPLGVYLRYHFRRGLAFTAATGLAASLFFEITQVTGVFGLYECPYRLFDVDDLVINASGAVVGWLLAGGITRRLPALEALDDAALARQGVPLGRRLTALLVDLLVLPWVVLAVMLGCVVLLGLGREGWWLGPLGGALVQFVVFPLLFRATPGKRLLLLELTGPGGERPSAGRLLARAVLLIAPVLPLALIALFAVMLAVDSPSTTAYRTIAILEWLPEAANRPARLVGALRDYLAPAQVGTFLVGLGLSATGAFLFTLLRHPERLGVHERSTGVRNRALPHRRARAERTDRKTAETTS